MAKSAMIRARINLSLKDEVEMILKQLGLSTTEAINLFYTQVKLRKGLPFEVVLPNELTLQTFEDTDSGNNVINCESSDEMFQKLNI